LTTTYTYDYNGVLISENTSGVTSYYLNDPNNPTGYSKAIQVSLTPGGSPVLSYVIGLAVEAQSDATNGTLYLLVDGHGSTRALADSTGAVVSGQTFDYDAFGDLLTNASSAQTVWLFGGDGVYDLATGLTYQLRRWRNGSSFTTSDTYQGSTDDPQGLNKYGYADANPVINTDPTGQFIDTLISTSEDLSDEAGEAETANMVENSAVSGIESGIDVLEGVESGASNSAFATDATTASESFAVGFASGSIGEAAYFATENCQIGNGVAGGILQAGNDLVANGAANFSWGSLAQAIGVGLISGLTSSGCFVTGTPVLLGDGTTEEAINDIQVGQRVATDGGAANSPQSKTAADPNATAVVPATWRELTIDAGDWEVQTLEAAPQIQAEDATVGGEIDLGSIVDLQEMGAPVGLQGTVESITACPTIQSGPGRVVLTTVSHLNDDLYTLTLKDASGKTETLGVTGYHRFYDQASGWTEVQNLYSGETLRGANGSLTVVSAVRAPGLDRVYNMTVEADHVYYVGDLPALVHNNCNSSELDKNLGGVPGDGLDAAHIVPSWEGATGAVKEMQDILEEVGIGINDEENGFLTASSTHNGTHTPEFINDLLEALRGARGNYQAVNDVLESAASAALGGHWE
jgi:RHS repeat-associated protein